MIYLYASGSEYGNQAISVRNEYSKSHERGWKAKYIHAFINGTLKHVCFIGEKPFECERNELDGILVNDLIIPFPNGRTISLPNVFDFDIGFGKISRQSSKDIIFEDGEIENVYFYILQAKRRISKKGITHGANYTYTLWIYHGADLCRQIDNVSMQVELLNPYEFIYSKIIEGDIIEYERHHVNGTEDKAISTGNTPLHTIQRYAEKTRIADHYRDSIVNENRLRLFFHVDGCVASLILERFAESADSLVRIDNFFEDDDTRNYAVEYDISRKMDIALWGHYLKPTFGCHAIYMLPVTAYKAALDTSKFALYREQYTFSDKQIVVFKEVLSKMYGDTDDAKMHDKLPHTIPYSDIDGRIQYQLLDEWLKSNFPEYNPKQNGAWDSTSLKKINAINKEKYLQIKADITADGLLKTRWKSELKLFELVHKKYPSALYQYRTSWLGLQSLDVFIPELNTAIEYQGIQHYEAVEHFGGEEGLADLKERDKRKKLLCSQNGIKLLEWNYKNDVNMPNLLILLRENNIDV